jgi:hypothetical protein
MEILEINLYNPHIMVIEEIGLDYNHQYSELPLSLVNIRRGFLNPLNEREIGFELAD